MLTPQLSKDITDGQYTLLHPKNYTFRGAQQGSQEPQNVYVRKYTPDRERTASIEHKVRDAYTESRPFCRSGCASARRMQFNNAPNLDNFDLVPIDKNLYTNPIYRKIQRHAW